MNELTLEGAGAVAAWHLSKEAAALLHQLLSPAAQKLGLMLGDVTEFVRGRVDKLLRDADERLGDHKPQQVPLQTFRAVVNGYVFEEDDDLCAKWSGLLASVAAGVAGPTSYPSILSQLSPFEAQLLDHLFTSRKSQAAFRESPSGKVIAATPNPAPPPLPSATEFQLFRANIERLGLCQNKLKLGEDRVMHVEMRLTEFGKSFIRACHGPRPEGEQQQEDETANEAGIRDAS